MIVQMTATRLIEVSGAGFQAALTGVGNRLPAWKTECKTLAEVEAAVALYRDEHGAPRDGAWAIHAHDASPRGVRKLRGFDKIEACSNRGVFVNAERVTVAA